MKLNKYLQSKILQIFSKKLLENARKILVYLHVKYQQNYVLFQQVFEFWSLILTTKTVIFLTHIVKSYKKIILKKCQKEEKIYNLYK